MKERMIYKNTTYFYDIIGLLILLFSQTIISIFLFLTLNSIFSRGLQNKEDYIIMSLGDILLLIVSYFHIRGIKNCFLYFFPIEEYIIDNNKLHYEKKLNLRVYSWVIEKFDISISEIENITSLPPRKFIYMSRHTIIEPLSYIFYFKPLRRICLELKDGKKYHVLNYVKKPNPFDFFADNKKTELQFKKIYEDLKKLIENGKKKWEIEKRKVENKMIYNFPLNERYNYILNKIIDEEKIFISKKDDNFIINGDSEAIKNLEILKDMAFEEVNFYIFYINYLSKKEYENKKVLVGYNGIDGKEVTMLKLKEDINETRDSKSSFLK